MGEVDAQLAQHAAANSAAPDMPDASNAPSDEVTAIRRMFSALPALSRSIFDLGATLGTGTFGRVHIVTYVPHASQAHVPSHVSPGQIFLISKPRRIHVPLFPQSIFDLIFYSVCIWSTSRLTSFEPGYNQQAISPWERGIRDRPRWHDMATKKSHRLTRSGRHWSAIIVFKATRQKSSRGFPKRRCSDWRRHADDHHPRLYDRHWMQQRAHRERRHRHEQIECELVQVLRLDAPVVADGRQHGFE